jgi:hypothetical protein
VLLALQDVSSGRQPHKSGVTIQNRQPKGRPTGGQSAPDERAEPAVSLAGPPNPDFPDKTRVLVDGRSGSVSGALRTGREEP